MRRQIHVLGIISHLHNNSPVISNRLSLFLTVSTATHHQIVAIIHLRTNLISSIGGISPMPDSQITVTSPLPLPLFS